MRVFATIVLGLTLTATAGAEPCRAPRDLTDLGAALPRAAEAIADGRDLIVVALGSSSTQGAGATTPARAYPAQLEVSLRQALPNVPLHVVNLGRGGERAGAMIARIETEVAAYRPDVVIWQTGVNDLLHQPDVENLPLLIEDGVRRLRALGADVVLMDQQWAPAVLARAANARLSEVFETTAKRLQVGWSRRYELMRHWARPEALGPDGQIIADGLHMNDASYRCTAQALSEGIVSGLRRAAALGVSAR